MSGRALPASSLRAVVGVAMLVRPDRVARLLGAETAGNHPILRFLGLRHLAQAALLSRSSARATTKASIAVDGAHVLSCLLLAAVVRPRHRPALRDAGLESGLLIATWAGRL